MRLNSSLVVAVLLMCARLPSARGEEALAFRGVIDDPDGHVNVRKEPRGDAAVIAKVNANEPFSFARELNAEWCRVRLKSGVSGWIHASRIKLFYTAKDLPQRSAPADEMDDLARRQGIDYYPLMRAAARADRAALKKFFTLDVDGAAAEEHVSVQAIVVHLLGDDALARFLAEQPKTFRKNVTRGWELGVTAPFDTNEYLRQHFPKCARLLLAER